MARPKRSTVKKAYSLTAATPSQIEDLKRSSIDPIFFLKNFVYVQHALRGSIHFDLYQYQEKMVEACMKHKNVVFLLGRQLGKCVSYNTLIYGDNKIGDYFKNLSLKDKIITYLENIKLKLINWSY